MPGCQYARAAQRGAVNTLVGESAVAPQWSYVVGSAENVLTMGICEIAKYTTTVHITVCSGLQNQLTWFKKPQRIDNDPPADNTCDYALDVRLYHDAGLAEVVVSPGSGQSHYGQWLPRYDYPNVRMYQRDEKSQLNQFLGELLAICLSQGRVAQQPVFTP